MMINSAILHGYTPEPGAYDEMWLKTGQVQPHWQPFVQAFAGLGPGELERTQQEVRRLLQENGVTYNVHGDTDGFQKSWGLDIIPLIISEADWRGIEAGMVQRAELLNLILQDLYGPRRLIKQGLLPMELIYSHNGFLRPCDGVLAPNQPQLIVYAADLARGPDGRMWVLSDRTQAPSGAGYALENRTVMAKVLRGMFREEPIARLSTFFRELQGALADLAPQQKHSPRVVVMTPGPHNETYFEHAYLAAYLGYSLVQGDDLTVREGVVSLKSLEGLQPVDVILRRVDDEFCDPLELREDSRLGVAGLLETARRHNVAIANPLGSSVLENPGLMPFLPGLARELLGQELILPSAATWWCGQPQELDFVLTHLDKLIIKKLSRQPQSRTAFGPLLSQAQRATLREQVKAQPHLFVGQEQVSFSTTPSLIEGRLEARHAVLRSFAVARRGSYIVMPGGLTRSAPDRGNFLVSNQAGGTSKDTWVLTSQPQKHISLWLQANRVEQAFKGSQFLPSRAAENLFWVGRYAERAEATARLLRMILDYLDDEPFGDEAEMACLAHLLRALTEVTATYPGFVGEESEALLADPVPELLSVALAAERPGSLLSNLRSLTRAAFAVRDLWSTDTWRVIEGLEGPWNTLHLSETVSLSQMQNELNPLITALMAFAGLSVESMTHEAGWLLLDMGRRLERSQLTMSFIGATLGPEHAEAVQPLLLETVLRTTENVITYRRRYRSYLHVQTVLDLLLLDGTNPRSVVYQLDRLQEHLKQLPQERLAYRLGREERLLLEASTELRLSDTGELSQSSPDSGRREQLDGLLAHLSHLLDEMAQALTLTYFSHAQVPHRLVSAAQADGSAKPVEPGEIS